MDNKSIKKILIIKLCCIGDIIQTIPALKAFKKGGASIHFLCVKWVDELIDMIPFVDKKILINPKNILDVINTIINLRKEKYDLIVNFHRDLKSYIFTFMLGAKFKAGFIWKGFEKLLTHKFFFDCKLHESLRYLSIAEGLGFERVDNYTLLIAQPIDDLQYKIEGSKRAGLFPGGGKNPGTVMFTKRWHFENYLKLAELLQEKGITVYFFGGEIDKCILKDSRLQNSNFKIIITKTLKELANYISRMDIFIAGDTGPLHIAAALGVKTIGLFGPSSPELVAPLNKNAVYIWKKENCSPCYVPETVHKKEFLKCNDNICMKNIKIEDVFNAINKITDILK